jgi:YesN/AraC family two-component response regulator
MSSFLYKEHFHNTHEIVFILEGATKFTISGKDYVVEKNSLLFINNFESHKSTILGYPYKRYYILLPQEFLVAYVNDPLLTSIIKQRPAEFNHVIQLNDTHSSQITAYFETMLKEFNSGYKYSYNMIGSIINMMLISLYRDYTENFPHNISSDTLRLISKVEQYIEDHYSEDISLREIALDINIDMYYLSRLFKKVTGLGFKDYLISQRLAKAKELLINTTSTITDVCTYSGLNNVNHFIRIFKERENITPLQFRKKM